MEKCNCQILSFVEFFRELFLPSVRLSPSPSTSSFIYEWIRWFVQQSTHKLVRPSCRYPQLHSDIHSLFSNPSIPPFRTCWCITPSLHLFFISNLI